MMPNKKLIIHDMEIVINDDEPISQTKKYENPEFNIDENMFVPSNIKNWSKIVLATIDMLCEDELAYENKIIIRGKEALFEYFEELYNIGMSDMQNHDYILQIPTILYEYKDIIEKLSDCSIKIQGFDCRTVDTIKGCSYNELIYHIQLGLYRKYIEYFKDLIKSPPSSFTKIAKLIDVCIKFSLNKSTYIELDTFIRLYDSFIENGCFGIVCSLKQIEGEYIYYEIDDYIYMLETLKIIDNELKNNIKIKARIIVVENRISKYNATYPNVNRRIIDYENIFKQVYDFENNNYYTIHRIELVDVNNEISTHYGLNQSRFDFESESEFDFESESESESESE